MIIDERCVVYESGAGEDVEHLLVTWLFVVVCFSCLNVTVLCMWWPYRLNIIKIKLLK